MEHSDDPVAIRYRGRPGRGDAVLRSRATSARTTRPGRRAYVVGYFQLATSNLGAKGAGLVRELLVAAMFGTSPALGMYVILKSGVDAVSVSATGAFQLSIVPRLVRLARTRSVGVDGQVLLADAIRIGLWAAVLSVVAMTTTLGLLGRLAPERFWLSIILSASLGVLMVGVVGLIGHHADGRFGRMSRVYLLTAVVMAVIVYPLGIWLGVVGLAVTWFVSVAIQAIMVWRPVLWSSTPGRPIVDWHAPSLLRASDFKLPVVVAGNQMVLCLIAIKLLASWDGLREVAVVNYALVFSGLFVSTIAKTMSSVVLKAAADGLPWGRFAQVVGFQLAASACVYVAIVLVGEPAIRSVFERGSFDAGSTQAVHRFLLQVFPPLALLGSLDLLVVYLNGRGLPVAGRVYQAICAVMFGAVAVACAFALWGADSSVAPLVFVISFATIALATSALLVWSSHRAGSR